MILLQQYQKIKKRWFQTDTCTGDAAISIPATPPPRTLPSEPANETLKPPVRLQLPLFSESKKEPEREIISKRPCKEKCQKINK